MGRSRKPSHLKIVEGTYRRDRAPANEPAPLPRPMRAPAWLNGRAAEIFDNTARILAEMGLASASDVDMLALLASRLEEVEVCTAILEDGGATYRRGTDGPIKRHPVAAMRSEAMRHAQKLCGEFGLSPATRARVSVAFRQDEVNPFGSL